ncbi:polyprenyl synthetase family protein [Nocardia alni]|uniref:polyprenyl synthetase family protein n=1 Tax=Nocardia alni TaxID=2815723 RepID=UPI001C21B67E|nr:polyprenyl synthetase family protein [Nocardia alni]
MSETTTLTHATATLANARRLCEPALRAAIESLPDPLRRMAVYHLGWSDPDGAAVRTGWGKGLRAALALAAASAVGADPLIAVPAAVAMELTHNFTLVHDDVMDADRMRRGRETVWSLWGASNAICLGDALHALAIRVLSDALPGATVGTAVTLLESAVVEVCRGQYEDCAFETRSSVTVEEYLSMAAGKTGALIGCACALGAVCAGADMATVEGLDAFGRQIGLAFQITDDVLGIWGDSGRTGKPVGGDLIRRKRSFPVVAALMSQTPAAAELSRLFHSDAPITAAQATSAAALVETAGGKRRSEQYADAKAEAAVAVIPRHAKADDLISLAYFASHRNR